MQLFLRGCAFLALLGLSSLATGKEKDPISTQAKVLDGEIDTSSKRVLTPDDPLPEGSLLIDSGTELQTHACEERSAEIRGDYRIVVLTGDCPTVRVVGNFNVLRVHGTHNIEVLGDDNALTWHLVPGDDSGRDKPLLTVRGARNLVAPGD